MAGKQFAHHRKRPPLARREIAEIIENGHPFFIWAIGVPDN